MAPDAEANAAADLSAARGGDVAIAYFAPATRADFFTVKRVTMPSL